MTDHPKRCVSAALYAATEVERAKRNRQPPKERARRHYDYLAETALDALRDAGYVLADIPEPNDVYTQNNGFKSPTWNCDFLDIQVAGPDSAVLRDDFEYDATLDQVIQQGLAFLAAANWMLKLKEEEEKE